NPHVRSSQRPLWHRHSRSPAPPTAAPGRGRASRPVGYTWRQASSQGSRTARP
ncbi:hypothetical protein O3P69_011678, partial [Scylla paramamosain]